MQLRATNHMQYQDGMEKISSDIMDKVINGRKEYDYSIYTKKDVLNTLAKEFISVEDFKILLSPAAEAFLNDLYVYSFVYSKLL